jgi:AcrR family transcriptional regulator
VPRIRAANIEAHKAKTRLQILEATERILAEMGAGSLNLADVAAEVGIGRTTIYEYFRHRDDLIASLVEERLPELINLMVSRLSPSLPAADRLTDLASATVEFVASDPVLGLILHRELPRLSPVVQDRIRLAHGDLAEQFAFLYRLGVDAGSLRAMPPDLAGRLIQDSIMAAARTVLAAADPAAKLPEVRDALTAFLLHGLSTDS